MVLEQPEVSDLVAMLECQAFALEDILEQKKKLSERPRQDLSPGVSVKLNALGATSNRNDTKLYQLTNSSMNDSNYPQISAEKHMPDMLRS